MPLTVIGLLTSSLGPVASPTVAGTIYPTWYIVISLVFLVPYLFALIEIWKMRKRGIELYTIIAIADYLVGFVAGFASTALLICSVVLIGLIWLYYKKMTAPSFLSPHE